MVVLLFATFVQDLREAGNIQQTCAGVHVVSPGDLHRAIQVSRAQTDLARKSMQDLI
jgi:hypothetical protein